MWQFRSFLPVTEDEEVVTLGEGLTPLCEHVSEDLPKLFFKVEYINPTCSFKDRSASLLLTKAKSSRSKSVVIDSSGNAAASISAYAARGGMECDVFVPSSTSPAKLKQIESYGASVRKVEGTRNDVLNAAVKFATENSKYYCGFQLNPFATDALKTIAYEIALQCGEALPDYVMLPMGTGGLLIGSSKGFKDLLSLKWIAARPKIMGVQPEGCSPIAKAFLSGKKIVPVDHPETVAEGLKIGNPLKGETAVKSIRESGGLALTVTDDEILQAGEYAAKRCGLFVEPSGAVSLAGLFKLVREGRISKKGRAACLLTGSGLKHLKA